LAPRALLYTEMVTAAALEHGDPTKLLTYDALEQPLALQLGGSDPAQLARAARLGEDWGYQEINLNVGCPSDRVQQGTFGACLMATPALVAECVAAMAAVVRIPVTVKCRLGIDDQPEEQTFFEFIDRVAQAPTQVFIVHARKAWLKGLSPKQNRDVPPLRYELVAELKRRRPDLTVVLNGGVNDLPTVQRAFTFCDGVMIGRQAYHHLGFLSEAHRWLYPQIPLPTPHELVEQLIPHLERDCAAGFRVQASTRHLLGLFAHQPGTRRYKQTLMRLSQTHPYQPTILWEALRVQAGADSAL